MTDRTSDRDGGRIRGLYVIIDPAACRGRSPVDIARAAVDGGAAILQWRDKRRDKGDQLADIAAILDICRRMACTFIINDHADLAVATGAHGVHVGPHDLPVEAVRALLGDGYLVGASTNNADEARDAVADGADYVAVGAIFPTATKENTRPADLDRIRTVKTAVDVPVVAIGGINASNIRQVVEAGADAAAVISAVCAADDPCAAAASLAAAFDERGTHTLDARRLAHRYVDLFNAGKRDDWIALFAADAEQHDPVGEPPRRGHDEIRGWWERAVAPYDRITIGIRSISTSGREAALSWTITERQAGKQRHFSGMDILTFDDAGLITELRAYWTRDAMSEWE